MKPETEPSSKPGKKRPPRSSKTNSYVIRDQNLKIENEQVQRIKCQLRKEIATKLEKSVKVSNVSEFLRKKLLKKSKNKN